MLRHWRRFKPLKRPQGLPKHSDLVGDMHGHLDDVIRRVHGGGRLRIEQIGPIIDEQAVRVVADPSAAQWFSLLVLRGPIAARAQQQMDKHLHGFDQKQSRLFELIDFNDTFISTVLALTDADRRDFIRLSAYEIAKFCKSLGVRTFSDQQYEAITHGLTREIAVYLGARDQGFDATMTSRSQDAMGVDIIIRDTTSGASLNVDCKTSSAYRYKLEDLIREGRLTESEASQADESGYVTVVNGHGAEAIQVTLLRIDQNEMGDIDGFVFREPELLGRRLQNIFASTLEYVVKSTD